MHNAIENPCFLLEAYRILLGLLFLHLADIEFFIDCK